MASPYLESAAASTRTERSVRASMPIGQCYLYEVQGWKGSYFAESDYLPRGKDLFLKDALEGAQQHDDLLAVWQINPGEGSMRDVSEDVARLWLKELVTTISFDPADATTWPSFVSRHITNDEAMEMAE